MRRFAQCEDRGGGSDRLGRGMRTGVEPRAQRDTMTLDDLGPRICILGPSGSGKSTLAVAIAQSRGMEAVHLDRLHHLPNTDWVPRPPAEFATLHDAAIMGECWAMDGNYLGLLAQRLSRATGFILLDLSTAISLYRYIRRCWFERDRRGALEGGRDTVKWSMIHHIVVAARASRAGHDDLFASVTVPKLRIPSRAALDAFYRVNGLER